MRLSSVWHVVWRHRALLTAAVALAAVASFAVSLRFPPLYEVTMDVEVVVDVGPLPPQAAHSGTPSVAELELAYYATLAMRTSWAVSVAVAKQLEAQYGWRVTTPDSTSVDGLLIQEIRDSLSSTKRGERGLTVRVRNYSPWRAQQFAAAVRDLLRDDGALLIGGAQQVRSVRVVVPDSRDTLPQVRAPSLARRVLAVFQHSAMALAAASALALSVHALIGTTRTTSRPGVPLRDLA